jgi:DNA-binding protein HU-beta
MNKGDLIDVALEKPKLSTEQAELATSATIDRIMDVVSQDKKVTLVGFGSFERRARKSREGRQPKTHQKIMIPATEVPPSSADKLLKEKSLPPKK